MPQKPEDFAENVREWSKWKHLILENYIKAFSGILQRFSTIYLIDGFAGAGRYKDSQKGSALLAAEYAHDLKNSDRDYELRCINVEQNQQVFQELEQATAPYSKLVTNYSANFRDIIPGIIEMIGEQPALFFLDPFGVNGLEWQTLLPVFQRIPVRNSYIVTEMLIRFDAVTVARLAGAIGNTDSVSRTNVRKLLDIFGLQTVDEWNTLYAEVKVELTRAIRNPDNLAVLAGMYRRRLSNHFNYAVQMPIRRLSGQFKYYLILATRNEKAITTMNDIFYNIEEMREKVIESRSSPMLFDFGDSDLLDELNVLKELILEVLQAGSSMTRSTLQTQIAIRGNYFGSFSKSHYTAVLGGSPRSIKLPQNFEPLDSEVIKLQGTPGNDKTIIKRVR